MKLGELLDDLEDDVLGTVPLDRIGHYDKLKEIEGRSSQMFAFPIKCACTDIMKFPSYLFIWYYTLIDSFAFQGQDATTPDFNGSCITVVQVVHCMIRRNTQTAH